MQKIDDILKDARLRLTEVSLIDDRTSVTNVLLAMIVCELRELNTGSGGSR